MAGAGPETELCAAATGHGTGSDGACGARETDESAEDQAREGEAVSVGAMSGIDSLDIEAASAREGLEAGRRSSSTADRLDPRPSFATDGEPPKAAVEGRMLVSCWPNACSW